MSGKQASTREARLAGTRSSSRRVVRSAGNSPVATPDQPDEEVAKRHAAIIADLREGRNPSQLSASIVSPQTLADVNRNTPTPTIAEESALAGLNFTSGELQLTNAQQHLRHATANSINLAIPGLGLSERNDTTASTIVPNTAPLAAATLEETISRVTGEIASASSAFQSPQSILRSNARRFPHGRADLATAARDVATATNDLVSALQQPIDTQAATNAPIPETNPVDIAPPPPPPIAAPPSPPPPLPTVAATGVDTPPQTPLTAQQTTARAAPPPPPPPPVASAVPPPPPPPLPPVAAVSAIPEATPIARAPLQAPPTPSPAVVAPRQPSAAAATSMTLSQAPARNVSTEGFTLLATDSEGERHVGQTRQKGGQRQTREGFEALRAQAHGAQDIMGKMEALIKLVEAQQIKIDDLGRKLDAQNELLAKTGQTPNAEQHTPQQSHPNQEQEHQPVHRAQRAGHTAKLSAEGEDDRFIENDRNTGNNGKEGQSFFDNLIDFMCSSKGAGAGLALGLGLTLLTGGLAAPLIPALLVAFAGAHTYKNIRDNVRKNSPSSEWQSSQASQNQRETRSQESGHGLEHKAPNISSAPSQQFATQLPEIPEGQSVTIGDKTYRRVTPVELANQAVIASIINENEAAHALATQAAPAQPASPLVENEAGKLSPMASSLREHMLNNMDGDRDANADRIEAYLKSEGGKKVVAGFEQAAKITDTDNPDEQVGKSLKYLNKRAGKASVSATVEDLPRWEIEQAVNSLKHPNLSANDHIPGTPSSVGSDSSPPPSTPRFPPEEIRTRTGNIRGSLSSSPSRASPTPASTPVSRTTSVRGTGSGIDGGRSV